MTNLKILLAVISLLIVTNTLCSTLDMVLNGEIKYLKNHIKILKQKRSIINEILNRSKNNIEAMSAKNDNKLYKTSPDSINKLTINTKLIDSIIENKDIRRSFFDYNEKALYNNGPQIKLESELIATLHLKDVNAIKEIITRKYENSKKETAYTIYAVVYNTGFIEIFDNRGFAMGSYQVNRQNASSEQLYKRANIIINEHNDDFQSVDFTQLYSNGVYMSFKVRIRSMKFTGNKKRDNANTLNNQDTNKKNFIVVMMNAGKIDPYAINKPNKVNTLNFNKNAKNNFSDRTSFYDGKKDFGLFLSRDYHQKNTDDLLYSNAAVHTKSQDGSDNLILGFNDCIMFFDLNTSKKIRTINFGQLYHPSEDSKVKLSYKMDHFANTLLLSQNEQHPVFQTSTNIERKIFCVKLFDEIVDVLYDKEGQTDLLVLTKGGSIMLQEIKKSGSCNIKYKISIPTETLPIITEINGKTTKTLDISVISDRILAYSRITNSVYLWKKEQLENKTDFQPTKLPVTSIFKLQNEIFDKKNFELGFMKNENFSNINNWMLRYDELKDDESTTTVEFYLVRKGSQSFDPELDYQDAYGGNEDWWKKFMEMSKTPIYILTIILVIGANLWWRGKKKNDDFEKKYENVNKMSGNYPYGNSSNKFDNNCENYGDQNDMPIETEKYPYKKARFSDETNNTGGMSDELKSLLSDTNSLAKEQKKIQEMLSKIGNN